jgi:hypothetical protein
VHHNLIYGNTAVHRGAGAFVYDCAPTFNNNTIAYNRCTDTTAAGVAAGIYTNNNAHCSGANNIITFNQATSAAQFAGVFDLSYSCSSQSIPGTGNITDDPQFMDAPNGNFTLQASSPCIDSGDPASPLDPDGSRVDMGAFSFDHGAPVTPPSDPQSTTPDRFALYQNSPNPFNSSTVIAYALRSPGRVEMQVFDVRGNIVETLLLRGWQEAGQHSIIWEATECGSGLYFCRIRTATWNQTIKMVLLR